jgi:RNA polymerase sigma-70 factor (ECF subfamily)
MIGDRAAAEELLQETFLRLAQARRRYRRTASFRTYLYAIARNLCLDALKSRRWREGSSPRRQERISAHVPGPSASLDADPQRALEAREQAEAVRAALLDLPPADREVLVLSRYEGLTYDQIAEVLGTTSGAIRVRAHRALALLRSRLEPFLDG